MEILHTSSVSFRGPFGYHRPRSNSPSMPLNREQSHCSKQLSKTTSAFCLSKVWKSPFHLWWSEPPIEKKVADWGRVYCVNPSLRGRCHKVACQPRRSRRWGFWSCGRHLEEKWEDAAFWLSLSGTDCISALLMFMAEERVCGKRYDSPLFYNAGAAGLLTNLSHSQSASIR